MFRPILLVITCLLGAAEAKSWQNEGVYPELNRKCPDFKLRNINYYHKKEANLQDFSGQWLVLDFWNKRCGACIASFPHVSDLQKQFEGKVQFMFVGIQDQERQVEAIYARFREEEKLVVPCAFDSSLAQRFDIWTAPYVIVIDPGGIVRAITYALDSADIQGFLTGNPPHLQKAYRMQENEDSLVSIDGKRPLLVEGNGGADTAFLFRSLLSAWNGFAYERYIPDSISLDSVQGRFQVVGVPLERLYNYAYFGRYRPLKSYESRPVLELRDPSLFKSSEAKSKNFFSYSLQLPTKHVPSSRLQEILRRELDIYFGYEVSIEDHPFPTWRLVAMPEAQKKLKSTGGPTVVKSILPEADFRAHNWPFQKFVEFLNSFSKNKIIDDSGITGNIDIDLTCVLLDIESVKRALNKYGLSLVPATEMRKALVIRDKPSDPSAGTVQK